MRRSEPLQSAGRGEEAVVVGTPYVIRAFFGRGTATGAGTLVGLTGKTAKTFLLEKADGSVGGAVFAGLRGERSLLFSLGERRAEHESGCDHDH